MMAIKRNALEVLDRQLAFRVKKNQYGIIAVSSAIDPYMRMEETQKMTEGSLRIILKHRFPVMIITKSTGVLRDLSILKEIDQQAMHAPDLRDKLTRGTIISFSISTLDEKIASMLEPGAPGPVQRLETMQRCKEEGFMVGLNCIPVLPFISDSDEDLENMVIQAKKYGADYILIGGLTLFGNQPADSKILYYKFLERNFPHLVPAYKKLYRIFFMPSKEYLNDLDVRASAWCEKHGMKRGIL